MNNKEQLFRIYNTLSLISTKGEDTIAMAQCLIALKDIIDNIKDNQEVE